MSDTSIDPRDLVMYGVCQWPELELGGCFFGTLNTEKGTVQGSMLR